MDINDTAYESHILKKVVNAYLYESVPATEEGLQQLLDRSDELVWEIATEIYTRSGYKLEFFTIRDIIRSRTEALTAHIANEKAEIQKRIAAERAEAARQQAEIEKRIAAERAEAERHRRSRLILLSEWLEASGRDNSLAELFLRIQDIVGEQLNFEITEITLDSSFVNNLGADELDASQLVMALEEEFDIEISDVESEGLATVEQLLDCIHKKLIKSDEC